MAKEDWGLGLYRALDWFLLLHRMCSRQIFRNWASYTRARSHVTVVHGEENVWSLILSKQAVLQKLQIARQNFV